MEKNFKLPDLPYSYSALEPYIDEKTMMIHHQKHHGGYVEKLNKILEGKEELGKLTIEQLLGGAAELSGDIRQGIINFGGGHANHSLFWEIMNPKPQKEPDGKLGEMINSEFGSFSQFKEKFSEKAMSLFGSGWVFLEVTKGGLNIKRHSFQNTPLLSGNVPILGLDVWEHAYYLKYQNNRLSYIEAWWNVVDWKRVGEIFLLNS
ncbi:superoxide dismutase [Candidatus Woesebacteria bacterium RIFOXYB1_FULL_38_16]|uniref:Superoxide dismutase n=1 Tax=Candidatus Woesebacteria bacterium RIFOXYB1_FULL_38_16 TaxID=1802538 RepID=A0A1F8CTL3_9BACT|nr:MAG: superoxide dismutase [Candidatus Woesebacteria bacterium RIFOXYA1_FULL_38_9]OGM79078.1 MAG: superoxide dismutase [Candidatus Woesebacteria bacterium RIFOXYB1_FULL_38_16]